MNVRGGPDSSRPYVCLSLKFPPFPGQLLLDGNFILSRFPSLIDGVVELSFHSDLAVGMGVHEGQAEAGILSAPRDIDVGSSQ